jgi:histone-lysine N-methyltransferase SETMAR
MFPVDSPEVIRIRDRAIIQFCFNLGYTPVQTLELSRKAFPESAPSRSTVYLAFSHFKSGNLSLSEAKRGGSVRDFDLLCSIEEFVIQNPSATASLVADVFKTTKETVKKYLIEDLQMEKKYLRWVPHILTDTNKAKRCEFAKIQLRILQGDKTNNFSSIITGDETWLPYETYADFVWTWKKDLPPSKPREKDATKKVMVTVFWGTPSFYLVDEMPPKATITATYFQENIVKPLIKLIKPAASSSKYYLHFDNAPAHRAGSTTRLIEESGFAVIPHPPYSPDLAPCDFYLFGKVKPMLKGIRAKSAREIIGKFKEILATITERERIEVMMNWMERLRNVAETGGEYCI